MGFIFYLVFLIYTCCGAAMGGWYSTKPSCEIGLKEYFQWCFGWPYMLWKEKSKK